MIRDVNAFRASTLVRRAFQVLGDDPAKELDDTLYTSFELEQSVRSRPEHCWMRGERLASADAGVAALAGVNSSLLLRNPRNSGVLVTLLELSLLTLGVLVLRLNADQTLAILAQTKHGSLIDTRFWVGDITSVPLSVATIEGAQGNLPVAQTHWSIDTQAAQNGNKTQRRIPPIVLGPGTDLYVTNNALNAAVQGSFFWLEREASRSELGRGVTV